MGFDSYDQLRAILRAALSSLEGGDPGALRDFSVETRFDERAQYYVGERPSRDSGPSFRVHFEIPTRYVHIPSPNESIVRARESGLEVGDVAPQKIRVEVIPRERRALPGPNDAIVVRDAEVDE